MTGKKKKGMHKEPDSMSGSDAGVQTDAKGQEGGPTVAVSSEGAELQLEAESGAAVDPTAREALLEDRLLRLQADFDNFRKRTLREREDLYRRANEDMMVELLPVLDHLELAFQAAGDAGVDHPLVKGFAMVGEQLRQVVRKFGLTDIDCATVDFDPNVHEAIQHLPSEKVPENGLIACTRAGYMLGNRLLRAAQVVVSSGPQGDAES